MTKISNFDDFRSSFVQGFPADNTFSTTQNKMIRVGQWRTSNIIKHVGGWAVVNPNKTSEISKIIEETLKGTLILNK